MFESTSMTYIRQWRITSSGGCSLTRNCCCHGSTEGYASLAIERAAQQNSESLGRASDSVDPGDETASFSMPQRDEVDLRIVQAASNEVIGFFSVSPF
jgi:hypothetical protein